MSRMMTSRYIGCHYMPKTSLKEAQINFANGNQISCITEKYFWSHRNLFNRVLTQRNRPQFDLYSEVF